MGWSAGNLPDQGTLCTEVMSLEVLRAQLARPQSLGDAVAQQQAGETAASPGLFSVGVGHCRWLAVRALLSPQHLAHCPLGKPLLGSDLQPALTVAHPSQALHLEPAS